jgi:mycothiol system anti-sigma-R factor
VKDDCRQALEKVYLYLDGEVLSEDERREIRTHLEECPPCLESYGLQAEVTAVVARLKGSASCPDRLKHQIAHFLHTD